MYNSFSFTRAAAKQQYFVVGQGKERDLKKQGGV